MERKSEEPVEVSGLDPRYECPICLSCLKEPVLTSCGHRFCSSCLHTWLDSRGGCCPVDNIALDKSRDLFPDHFTRREILNQTTFCRICSADVGMTELDEHLATHQNNSSESDVNCPFRSIGCLMNVSKEQMTEHLELQIHHHLCLIQASHLKLLKSTEERRTTSALAQEASFWEPEEKGNVQEQSNKSLMKALYERVIILEQRCHEQDAQIQRLKNDLAYAENKFQDMSALHASGQYLWNIRQFSEKLTAMRSGGRQLFFSQGFYTSPVGYKICGRINVSPHNDDQLALLIHLMKSPHDSALEWPFNGRIHLSVIHPTNPDFTVSETMMSRPELDSFKRPTREMNTKAFGYPQFISIRDILAKGFLTDDNLLVKIHIQCV